MPYPIVCLVTVSVLDVHTARFNLLDRAQKKAAAKMAEKEDSDCFNVFYAAANYGTSMKKTRKGRQLVSYTVPQTVNTAVTRASMANLFAEIEAYDAPVSNLLFNPRDYRDIRGTWTDADIDRVTQAELLKTGYAKCPLAA